MKIILDETTDKLLKFDHFYEKTLNSIANKIMKFEGFEEKEERHITFFPVDVFENSKDTIIFQHSRKIGYIKGNQYHSIKLNKQLRFEEIEMINMKKFGIIK